MGRIESGINSPRHGGPRSHGKKGGQTGKVCRQGEGVDRVRRGLKGSNSEGGEGRNTLSELMGRHKRLRKVECWKQGEKEVESVFSVEGGVWDGLVVALR